MKQNFDEVLHLLYTISGNLMAIALTETWLTVDTQDLYAVPGYKFVSRPRLNKIGGGVGLFIKNDYEFKICQDLHRRCDYIECFLSIYAYF